MASAGDLVVLGGTASRALAAAVARELGSTLGVARIERFPDGEVSVLLETDVRRRDVAIVQSTSPPVDEHLVELLATADAACRSGAASVTAVVPYFGYGRADKRLGRREPITASLVARLLEATGIDRVISVDLHTPQIEGFFQCPVENLTAAPLLTEAVRPHLEPDVVVVSPDVGRLAVATRVAQALGTDAVVLYKVRESATRTAVQRVVGDVRDRPCLIVDDIVSTGETVRETARALRAAGARPGPLVAVTHYLYLPRAREALGEAGIGGLWTTDTIEPAEPGAGWPGVRVCSVAPIVAAALRADRSA